jgi:hypothetical protein
LELGHARGIYEAFVILPRYRATIYLTTDRTNPSSGHRQASAKHRGVVLPEDMTPACLDDIARLLNGHQLETCEDSDAEGAVKIFEAVRRHLR